MSGSAYWLQQTVDDKQYDISVTVIGKGIGFLRHTVIAIEITCQIYLTMHASRLREKEMAAICFRTVVYFIRLYPLYY